MNESLRYCFVPHETEIFKLAEIVASSGSEITVVDLQDKLKRSTINESLVVPIGSVEEMNNPPSDLIKLIHVHRPGILHTLKTRFFKDLIYTSIGPILVALNPFKWIAGIYGEDVMEKYKANERTLSENPHVFAVAHEAFSDLYMGQNQSLIISGESGAGKTEATKQALNYLAYIAGSATGIQSKILKASPILEGWGNAKTLRNNNSSRFGKYIEIWFDKRNNSIIGSSNTTYILEKSRVVFQEKDERNYHVFYQLLKGATKEVLSRLKLGEMAANPNTVQYINQSGCISIDDVDDAADHHEANAAFNEIGFTAEEQNALYAMIAGILHFGNVSFDANPSNTEESVIDATTDVWLVRGTEMFGVDYGMLKQAMLTKKIKSGNSKRTSVAFAAYLPKAAMESKNALTKEIYKRCFDWIVNQINVLMGNDTSTASSMIGILDIFGFEIFQKNSFEQLCINLANEALQQHFNFNIFQAEMDTYLAEDVPVPKLEYKDNQDVLDLIIKKPKGLIAMLDEEGIVPKGSFEGFLNKFHKQHTDNPRYKAKGKSKDAVNDLGIVHYAGEVYYDVSLFLIKNKDTLSQDLVEVFQLSTVPFVANLFDENFGADFGNGSSKSSPDSPTPNRSLKRSSTMNDNSPTSTNKLTVGRKFAVQLESLIANLNSTKPRYIRCVKPNQAKKPNIFVSHLTNEQLTYSGVFEAVIIMQNGYPFRLPHSEFRGMFHMLLMRSGKLPIQHDLIFDETAFAQYVAAGNSVAGVEKKKSGGKKSKGFRNCSREMCMLLVSAVAETVGEVEQLMKCHVGRSRVFYQATQNKILLRLRQEMLLLNAVKIQKYTRRFNCHKIMSEISRLENVCTDAIQTRSIDVLKKTSAEISALVVRLNKLNKSFVFSLEIIDIAVDYATALEEEMTYTATLKNLLTVDKRDMLTKFDELETTLNLAKDIDFSAVHRGVPLSLQWDDNQDLVEYATTIENFAISVKIRRKLVSNIECGNEVLLEEAIAELRVLKQTKRVEANFCDEEVKTAAKLIQDATEHYAQVLDAVKAAIEADLQAHKTTSPRASTSHSSSGKVSLSDVVTQYKDEINPTEGGKKSSGQSERARQLLVTCSKLHELRSLCEANEWQKAWLMLQSDWKEFLISQPNVPAAPRKTSFSTPTPLVIKRKSVSGNTTASPSSPPNIKPRKASAGVVPVLAPTPSVFVPQVVLGLVIEEIRNISLAAINNFIVPKLKAALSRNAVPPTPFYTEFNVKEDEPTVSVVGINTTELNTELTEAEHYSECFDDALVEYMAVVREHLFIRQEVAYGVRDKIIHCIGEVKSRKVIDGSSADYQNLMKYGTLYELEGLLYKYTVDHAVVGQQGNIDFSTVITTPLSEVLGRCAAIQVNGSDWQNLVNICLSVDKIRQLLVKGDYPSAVKWIDSLLSSAAWTAMQVKKATPSSLGEGMTAVVNSVTLEFKLIRVEIAHILAYRLITGLLKNTAITGEVDALDYSNKSVDTIAHIRADIDRNKGDLVPGQSISSLLSSAENLLAVRDLFYHSNWAEAEQRILPLFDSDFVCQSHEECTAELTLLFYDVFNRKVKAALMSSISAGFVVRVGDTEWNASEVNTAELKEALDLTDIGYKLSQHCLDMLRAAKIVYLLRVLANDQHWEPENMFFFGHVAIDHLSDHIVGMDKNPLLAKECSAIDRLIQYLQVMDSKLFTRKNQTLVDMVDVQSVTVAQVLSVVKNSTFPADIQALIEPEINAFLGLTVERNCRLLLLLAASTGKVKGTIESLQSETANTSNLKNVIQFVEQTMTTTALSETVKGWVAGAKQLQTAREAVIKSNSPESLQMSSLAYNMLVELLSETDTQTALDNTPSGFPLEELTLIFNKLLDLTATQEIYQAMVRGAPTFTDGKFNVSRVEFVPVHERLTAAKKLTKISDRLDKLFFFAGLCVNVRKAVTAQQWELTMTGEKSAVPMDRNVITVKTCMQEWAQAQRLFSVEGVPPECLKTEFLLVSREWDRRLTLQQFANAFKQGCVEGVPSSLQLNNIRTSQLQIEITRAKAIEEETKEVDNDIQFFMKAAQELIDLRCAADAIQKSYKRSFEFRKASSDVRYITKETSFLDDAINSALNTVEGVYKPPFLIMQEWLPMEAIIAKLDASFLLSNTKKEVNLLRAESLERVFVTDTLTLLYQLAGCIHAPIELAVLLNKLLMSITAYYNRKEQYTHDHTIKSERTSATLEFVLDSAVVLVHFIRARANNLYDEKYHRQWKEDVNFTNTPRLMSLVQHLQDGSYTMQQILRAYVKFDIHFTVRKYLSQAVDEVENEVSRVEMIDALTNPLYVARGLVGNVRVSEDSIEHLQSVLTRIDEMGLELPAPSQLLHQTSKLMLRLRTAVKLQQHAVAIGIVDEWIGDGTRNMHTLFGTFFSDRYDMLDIVRDEFATLAKNSFDGYWQILALEALLDGRVRGSRVALQTHAISWLSIDTVLSYSKICTEENMTEYSTALSALCTEVRSLRSAVIDNHTVSFNTDVFNWVSLNQPISVASNAVGHWVTAIVMQGTATVNLTATVNVNWSEQPYDVNFQETLEQVSAITDDIAKQLNDSAEFPASLTEALSEECALVLRHNRFIDLGCSLENFLRKAPFLTVSEHGVCLSKDIVEPMRDMLVSCRRGRWDFNLPQEFWWATLAKVSESLLVVLQKIHNFSSEVNDHDDLICIVPGSPNFAALLPLIQTLLYTVTEAKSHFSRTGFKKKREILKNIEDAIDILRQASKEHYILFNIDRLVVADEVFTDVNEDGLMSINVRQIHKVAIHDDEYAEVPVKKSKSALSKTEEYVAFAEERIAMLKGLNITSSAAGRMVCTLAQRCIEFRVAVIQHHWHTAKQIATTIEYTPLFPSRSNDVTVFNEFVRILSSRRNLEYAILHCNFPTESGWSINKNVHMAREVVNSIRTSVLAEKVECESKDQHTADKSVVELVKVGKKLLELAQVMKIGQWVSRSDLRKSNHADNRIQIALYLKDSIATFQELMPEIDFFDEEVSSSSVYAIVTQLQVILKASKCLDPHLVTFLTDAVIATTEMELTIVQLEQLSVKTFRECRITGHPGQLVMDPAAIHKWEYLINSLETAPNVLSNWQTVRQSYESAMLLNLLLHANNSGDLKNLCKFTDLLLFLNSRKPAVSVPHTASHFSEKTVDELLEMEEWAYNALFDTTARQRVNSSEICRVSYGRKSIYKVEETVAQYIYPEHSSNPDLIKTTYETVFECSWTECNPIRAEVKEYLELLRHHCIFECQYLKFATLVSERSVKSIAFTTSAFGPPGELLTTNINFALLRRIMASLKEQVTLNSDEEIVKLDRCGHLLYNACHCLQLIRQGQLLVDELSILTGLHHAFTSIRREKEFKLPENCTPFGGQEKLFMISAEDEVVLADLDMKQRQIIVGMSKALASTGVPSGLFPFDLSVIQVSPLTEILEHCNLRCEPTCGRAIQLYKSCLIMFTVREMTSAHAWVRLKEFMDVKVNEILDGEKLKEVLDTAQIEEFERAHKVMSISYAVEMAIDSYTTGNARGRPGKLLSDDGNRPNASPVQKALALLKNLQRPWVNAILVEHINACTALLKTRRHLIACEWQETYDLLKELLSAQNLEANPIFGESLTELQLIFEHASYVIVRTAMMDAVCSGMLEGEVGNTDSTHTTLSGLMDAYKISQTIAYEHIDIAQLERSVETLFRLRRAILCNNWTNVDHTGPYLHLLGSNYVYPHEDCRDLFATLPLHEVVPGQLETVEDVVADISEVTRDSLVPEAWLEINFIREEVMFRKIVSGLIKHVHSPGATGIPGAVDVSSIETQHLEEAIEFAERYPVINYRKICCYLLRDAKWLLYARKGRLLHDWSNMDRILNYAFDTHKEREPILNLELPDYKEYNEVPADDFVTPVVWKELNLLKHDAVFHISCCAFAKEMSKDEDLTSIPTPTLDDNDVYQFDKEYEDVHRRRIVAMEEILEYLSCVPEEILLTDEFKRLLEAQMLALELRQFYYSSPSKSPQAIIDRIAAAKRRDKTNDVVCYMSLLICDISKMSNVLDFPMNLEIIQNEILKGQRYFSCPVGQIILNDINVDVMSSAYAAAVPSLEIMGTEENDNFMKLANAVMILRRTLMNGDLRAVMKVISDHEDALLQQSMASTPAGMAVSDEVLRLRTEMENFEATKVIEFSLKNGRNVDVFSIARLLFIHDSVPPSVRALNHTSEADFFREDGTIDTMTVTRTSSYNNVSSSSHRYIGKVLTSIQSLQRAITVASKLHARSEVTEYYLHGAKFILELRRNILNGHWDAVREIVASVGDHDLPAIAMDEVRGIQEGLIYEQTMSELLLDISEGSITGTPFAIDFAGIDYEKVSRNLRKCEKGRKFTDKSALLLLELAGIIRAIRKAFLEAKWLPSVTNDYKLSARQMQNQSRFRLDDEDENDGPADMSLEDAIDKFLAFQHKNFDFLKSLFNCDTSAAAAAAPPSSPTATSKSAASAASLTVEKDEWRQYIWNCLWDVVAEVKLVLEVIKYNKTLSAMISCISVLPLSVSSYFLARNSASSSASSASDRAQLIASIQPQYNMQEEELISQTSSIYIKGLDGKKGRRRSSVMRYDTGEEYQLSELHDAIRFAEEYWNDPDHQAMRLDPNVDHDHNNSEELLLLLNTTRMIYKFRCVLASHRPDEFTRMIALSDDIKVQNSHQMLSSDYGTDELLCYQTVTEQFTVLREGLLRALNKDRMIGSLDCIGSASGHDFSDLEQWIVESNKFLGTAANLSIGLIQLVDQASFIYRLRNAILQKSWALVGSYLTKCNVLTTATVLHSKRWALIREELLHIFLANKFHTLQAAMFHTVHEFHLIGSVQSQRIVLKQDFEIVQSQMAELCELVRVGKDSLSPLSAFALVLITDAFYQHPLFIAWHALYRLLSVICIDGAIRWYDKTQINDNPKQLVNRRLDPFLYDFFALSQSNFMDATANVVDQYPVVLVPPESATLTATADSLDTVFATLLPCNWTGFPPNIRAFFEETRNNLIDQYLRNDLAYFCSKGCATLDKAGNILISDLYLQFLTLTLSDVQKARRIAEKYYIRNFAFSSITSRWIESAELIKTCRGHLVIENSMDALEKTMVARKILTDALEGSAEGLKQLSVASMDILLNNDFTLVQDELTVFVKYVVAVHCKKTIMAVVRKLNDILSIADTEWTYNDLLPVAEVKALFAVVNNPRTNFLAQTPYLTKLLSIANNLKSALSATFMGNTDRLQRNIDTISALCGISERVDESASVVQREDVVLSGMQAEFNTLFIALCYVCTGTSQIDLFVVSTKQHRKRGLAKSTASEIAEKVLNNTNNRVVNTLAKRLLKVSNPVAAPGLSPKTPVSLNYGNTPRLLNYNQLYKSPTTGAVPVAEKMFTFEPNTPASDGGLSVTNTSVGIAGVGVGGGGGTLMPSEDVTNVTVGARKITRRLIAALCELKYFEEENDVYFVQKERRSDYVLKQRARIHKSLSNEVPYYCFERIRDLTMDIDDDYRVMEPLWTVTLFIVLHYLNQAVQQLPQGGANVTANDATLLEMPYELFWFVHSLNLSKLVLSDDGNETASNSLESERPSFVVICQAIDRVLGEQNTHGKIDKTVQNGDLFGVGDIADCSPELVKTAIRNLKEATQNCEKVKYPVGVAAKSASQSKVLMKFLSGVGKEQ